VNNLVEEWNRIKTGEKYFIQYKLEFPVFKAYSGTPPLPTVKSVIVNDRVLCSGETPSEYAELMCEKKIVYIYIYIYIYTYAYPVTGFPQVCCKSNFGQVPIQ